MNDHICSYNDVWSVKVYEISAEPTEVESIKSSAGICSEFCSKYDILDVSKK